jgi:signal transduction histidine kinase
VDIVNNLATNQLVSSILGLFLVNILILMVVLLLRQKSTMEKELLRLQDQIAALADSTYGVKKRVVEAEKRISVRINQLKAESVAASRNPPKEAVSIDSLHTPYSQGIDIPKQSSGKPTRASSKAEEDIMAAISGL